jgi:hypothetical protein
MLFVKRQTPPHPFIVAAYHEVSRMEKAEDWVASCEERGRLFARVRQESCADRQRTGTGNREQETENTAALRAAVRADKMPALLCATCRCNEKQFPGYLAQEQRSRRWGT